MDELRRDQSAHEQSQQQDGGDAHQQHPPPRPLPPELRWPWSLLLPTLSHRCPTRPNVDVDDSHGDGVRRRPAQQIRRQNAAASTMSPNWNSPTTLADPARTWADRRPSHQSRARRADEKHRGIAPAGLGEQQAPSRRSESRLPRPANSGPERPTNAPAGLEGSRPDPRRPRTPAAARRPAPPCRPSQQPPSADRRPRSPPAPPRRRTRPSGEPALSPLPPPAGKTTTRYPTARRSLSAAVSSAVTSPTTNISVLPNGRRTLSASRKLSNGMQGAESDLGQRLQHQHQLLHPGAGRDLHRATRVRQTGVHPEPGLVVSLYQIRSQRRDRADPELQQGSRFGVRVHGRLKTLDGKK